MTVRGTRTVLDVYLCTDVQLDKEAFTDTMVSAVNDFSSRIRQGDNLIHPDPWFAPVVEGVDCGVAVMSGPGQTTMTWKVGLEALLGMFKFYTTIKIYGSSQTVVLDRSLPQSQWRVGVLVIGPLDL